MAQLPALTLAPIADGQVGDASDWTTPFNELLNGVNDVLDGDIAFTRIALDPAVAHTIASDEITVTSSHVVVDTEGGASSDDLKKINGVGTSRLLFLRIANAARAVVLKHDAVGGNIRTASQRDYNITSTDVLVVLIYNGANWIAVIADNTKYLNVGVSSTLTISSGVVTRTQVVHKIDTEGAAASDDLDTISGGVEGDVIRISNVNAARIVNVKHGTGNIRLPYGLHVVLSDPDTELVLKRGASNWLGEIGVIGLRAPISTTITGAQAIRVPERSIISEGNNGQPRLAVIPDVQASHGFQTYASAATLQSNGIAAPTILNTPVNSNDSDGAAVTLPSTAVAGQLAGFITATFNLVRRQWNARFIWRIKTDADISSLRLWLGLTSAAMTNSDTAPGHFAGFRYSTGASDTNWQFVTRDGTTQHVTDTGVLVVINTLYVFELWIDDSGATVYCRINGTLVSKTSNLPSATQDLGWCTRVIPITAVIRLINFYRMDGYWK